MVTFSTIMVYCAVEIGAPKQTMCLSTIVRELSRRLEMLVPACKNKSIL